MLIQEKLEAEIKHMKISYQICYRTEDRRIKEEKKFSSSLLETGRGGGGVGWTAFESCIGIYE